MLCDDLEGGMEGMVGGSLKRERGYMYRYSCCVLFYSRS